MKYNAALLNQFTIVYISEDELVENKTNMIKILFQEVFSIRDYSQIDDSYKTYFDDKDMILLEANSLEEKETKLLEIIRSFNRKIPIVLLTNEINKEVLDYSLDFNISGFLLRPLKIQDLTKQALVRIQKYHRRINTKKSLQTLSSQIKPLSDEISTLKKQNEYQNTKIDFYEKLHKDFLSSLKIDKSGNIKSISGELVNKFDANLIGENINKIFKTPSKIQKAFLISLKERKLTKELDIVKFKDYEKEYTINIMPFFENKNDGEYFFYIFF